MTPTLARAFAALTLVVAASGCAGMNRSYTLVEPRGRHSLRFFKGIERVIDSVRLK